MVTFTQYRDKRAVDSGSCKLAVVNFIFILTNVFFISWIFLESATENKLKIYQIYKNFPFHFIIQKSNYLKEYRGFSC